MSETIEVLPLEKRIENALVKANITEALIAETKAKCLPMKLKGLDDKEGYLEISSHRKDLKKFLSEGKKRFKEGREDAIREQEMWIAKERWFEGEIKPIIAHLESQEDAYEAEQNRKKEAKRRLEEEQLFRRQLQLTKMGAQLQDGKLILEDVEVDLLQLRQSDEDTYQNVILSEFRPIWERKEAERIEEEKRVEEEKRQQEAERKALEEAQAELKRQQDELKRQQEEMQRQKNAAEEAAAKKAHEEFVNMRNERISFLVNMGLSFDFSYNAYVFNSPEFSACYPILDITDPDPEKWNKRIKGLEEKIANAKAKIEEKRLADIAEKERIAAEKAVEEERQRVQAQKDADEAEAERKRIEEQERQEKANDSQKWVLFVDKYLSDIKFPEMKSPKYRKIIAMAKEKIEEIQKLA